jgi:uncharacterized protein (TIGR02147 family)
MNYAGQVKSFLVDDFARARARNPSYSMRAYARKLGISQSVISELLSGKRPMTKKTARRILAGLACDPAETERILEGGVQSQAEYTAIDMDQFHLVSEWYYYAILSLAQTEDFKSSARWIALRLGISPQTASAAVSRLLRLKLLVKKAGKVSPTGASYCAISPTPNLALRKANQENLHLAEKALAGVAPEARDFTAITLCFDPDRIHEARRMIKAFRQNFDRVMESGTKKDVYKLCVQLFPLTKLRSL